MDRQAAARAVQEARRAADAGDIDRALGLIQDAQRLDPTLPHVWFDHARLLERVHPVDPAAVAAAYERFLETAAASGDSRLGSMIETANARLDAARAEAADAERRAREAEERARAKTEEAARAEAARVAAARRQAEHEARVLEQRRAELEQRIQRERDAEASASREFAEAEAQYRAAAEEWTSATRNAAPGWREVYETNHSSGRVDLLWQQYRGAVKARINRKREHHLMGTWSQLRIFSQSMGQADDARRTAAERIADLIRRPGQLWLDDGPVPQGYAPPPPPPPPPGGTGR